MKWKGVITKKIDDDTYNVLFSINSIELDNTRDALKRPRYLQEKRVKIYDIRLSKKFPVCENKKKQTFNDSRICNIEKLNKELYLKKQTQDDNIRQGIDSKRYTYSTNEATCEIIETEITSFNCEDEQSDIGLFDFFEKVEIFHEDEDPNTNNNLYKDANRDIYNTIIDEIDVFEEKLKTMSQTQKQNLKYVIDDIKKTQTGNQFNALKLNVENKIINTVYNHMINMTPNFNEIYQYTFN